MAEGGLKSGGGTKTVKCKFDFCFCFFIATLALLIFKDQQSALSLRRKILPKDQGSIPDNPTKPPFPYPPINQPALD